MLINFAAVSLIYTSRLKIHLINHQISCCSCVFGFDIHQCQPGSTGDWS
jgi:hypothetical protein